MEPLDVLTVLVLVVVAARITSGTRVAVSRQGRGHVRELVSGLRVRHFAVAVPALAAVGAAAVALASLPGLSWGWWTAIGGVGNPVTGGTERTTGTVLEWLVPLVFLVLLLPALPLFAEAEERMFRLGSERRSRWGRIAKSVQFGLTHALIGIPIGAALGLSLGGAYFTWAYLRRWRATESQREAVLESTRAHLAYNVVVVALVLVLVVTLPE
ncbi:MAG: hypothetical protein ABIV94_00550 [Acidimicrobiales bacterium]